MARIRKRFEKIMNNPVDVKWDQLVPIIEHYGLIVDSPKGGSHYLVYDENDPDNTMISAPVHNNRLKKVYVKQIIALIESMILEEE